MATDLQNRPETDPTQDQYDNEFADLTDPEHYSKDGASPKDLRSAETGLGAEDKLGNGYNPGDAPSRVDKIKGLLGTPRRKKTAISGGVAGGIVTILIAVAGVSSGPLQIIHLSQLLSHNFTKGQSDTEDRTGHLLRYAKAYKNKDFRYTRVGPIAEITMNKAVADFEKVGVKFEGSDFLGRPLRVSIDRPVLENKFPETKGMTDAQFKDWLGKSFGSTGFEGSGKDIHMNIEGLKASAMSKLIGSSRISLLGDGKVEAAIKTRSLKKFFGLGSMFHPLSRAIDDKISSRIVAEKAKQKTGEATESETEIATRTEQELLADQRAPIEEPGVAASDNVKETAKGVKGHIVDKAGDIFGYIWITGCVLKGAGDAIIVINHKLTVVPSTLQAINLISVGAQTEYGGNDVTAHQVGGTVQGLSKNGHDIWEAPAMQALSGKDVSTLKKDKDGSLANDISDDYKQAFGNQTTANNIKDTGVFLLDLIGLNEANSVLSKIPVVGGVLGTVTDPCGLPAAVTVVTAGLALKGISAFAAAPSGGGSLALKFAIVQTVKAGVKEGIKFYLGSKLLGYVTNKIVNSKAAPRLAADAFSGIEGGGLIPYGARAAGNLAAIGSGGVALDNNASTIVGTVGERQQQQFRSESTFAKLFDINDYRSLSGRFSALIKPTVADNLFSVFAGFLNMGKGLSSIFSSFTPSTSAAGSGESWTGNYDWGFPQYGIPDGMLKDSTLADPYQNLEAVGQYLSSACSEIVDKVVIIGNDRGACVSGTGGGYTRRIKTCFGNDLTYGGGSSSGGKVWDISPASNTDIDPNSNEYRDADCGGTSNDNWKRIVMFINDANNIKSIDCFTSDSGTSQQSCIDEGLDGAGANQTPADNGATQAGAQIVGDIGTSSDSVQCAANTKDLGVVTSQFAGSIKKEAGDLKIRICQLSSIDGTGQDTAGTRISGGAVVNSRVSGAWQALGEKAKSQSVNLSADSSFRLGDSCGGSRDGRRCARPNQSLHQLGIAIDFAGPTAINESSQTCAARQKNPGNPTWDWLNNNAAAFGFKQYSAEAWHWDALPAANRCGGDGS